MYKLSMFLLATISWLAVTHCKDLTHLNNNVSEVRRGNATFNNSTISKLAGNIKT